MQRRLAYLGIGILFGTLAYPASAFRHVRLGEVVENVELATLKGSSEHLLSTNATANVFLFFRPHQENSRLVLKELAVCEKDLMGKAVHWVAIVSETADKAAVEVEVKETGIAMPVLIDKGDALYGKLGVVLHPTVGIADKNFKLVAYQPFMKVNYCEVVKARILHLLGEINSAELEQTLHPPASRMGGDAEVARRYLHLSEALYKAKSYDKALDNIQKCLEKDARLTPAHVLRGKILIAQGKDADALAAFRQVLKLDPNNANAKDELKRLQSKP